MIWGGIRRRCLGISLAETLVERRGFLVSDVARRERLELIGGTFVRGYHAALEEPRAELLAGRLVGDVPLELQGFAFEGAAMGLALLDAITPWNRGRLRRFLDGPGAAHPYMIHVGVGWAFARIPWLRRNLTRRLEAYDPLLRWLIVDGYGFHQAYFHPREYVEGQRRPAANGYVLRAFDQGVGRCLWFVMGADVPRVAEMVGKFVPERRSDLWSGLGLACTYAGGVSRDDVAALREAAGEHRLAVAQGAAFAAKTRLRAGNSNEYVDLACRELCGVPAERAAAVTDEALPVRGQGSGVGGQGGDRSVQSLPSSGSGGGAYENWRVGIQRILAFSADKVHNEDSSPAASGGSGSSAEGADGIGAE